MDSEMLALHVMSLISNEMDKGVSIVDACRIVHEKMKVTMVGMHHDSIRSIMNQSLVLMVDLGRLDEYSDWENNE